MQTARGGGSLLLILAHGAGSSADFLGRAFPPAACGMATEYLDNRTGEVTDITGQLLAAARRARSVGLSPVLGGVSIGAHAAARAGLTAAPGLVEGLVLVMPAWHGPCAPDGPTALAAAQVAEAGAEGVLRQLLEDPLLAGDWVVEELHRAWLRRPTLAAELAAAARGSAPLPSDLARLRTPTLVIALAEDPVHPLQVADAWAEAIPGARLDIITRQAPTADRAVFGRAVGAWARQQISAPR